MDTLSANQDIYREFIRNLFKIRLTNRKQEKSADQTDTLQATIQTQTLAKTSRTTPRNDSKWVEHPLSKGGDFRLFQAAFYRDNEKKKVP